MFHTFTAPAMAQLKQLRKDMLPSRLRRIVNQAMLNAIERQPGIEHGTITSADLEAAIREVPPTDQGDST